MKQHLSWRRTIPWLVSRLNSASVRSAGYFSLFFSPFLPLSLSFFVARFPGGTRRENRGEHAGVCARYTTQESIGRHERRRSGTRRTTSSTNVSDIFSRTFPGGLTSSSPPGRHGHPQDRTCAVCFSPSEHGRMADTEFEEFRHYFERLPQHLKAPLSNYTLVHDVMIDDSPTSSQGSDGEVARSCDGVAADSEDEEVVVIQRHDNQSGHTSGDDSEDFDHNCSIVADSDFSLFGGLSSRGRSAGVGGPGPGGGGNTGSGNDGRDSVVSDVGDSCSSLSSWPTPEHVPSNRPGSGGAERRRRRLPEIPKNKKSLPMCQMSTQSSSSLADELGAATGSSSGRPHLVLRKCHSRLRHEDSSPDSERMATDSGHSTAHSPENGPKSVSPIPCNTLQNTDSVSPSSTPEGSGGVPFTQLELLEATHRGLHKFVPRHHDEIDLEIGDPIYVQKEADDLWCEGVNLRTGRQGIFPSAYAVDMDYSDFDPAAPKVKRERYLLGYLGSVETLAHKGTGVVCQAVRRIVGNSSQDSPVSQSCILEVSDQGLRMVDRSKPRKSQGPCHDYFYSLKNVSFCAFHPRDHRYLGFITKHPTLQRFACHVFIGQESTRPVAEAVGRAFHRFYTKFIETAFPIEDIYIE